MPFVHQPIQITASPSKSDRKVRLESCGDAPELADRHRIESSTLDSRHIVLCDEGPLGKIFLPPPKALPQRPKPRAEPNVVHGRSMVADQAYPAVTYAPHACYPRIRSWIGRWPGASAAR